MQTPYFIKRATTCFGFVLASAFLFLILVSQQACKQEPAKDTKVYKNISVKEINDALALSKTNKVRLNIYPVKLSDDPKRNDFDFLTVYQDVTDPGLNLGSNFDMKTFEDQSTRFVKYLKSIKVPQDKVPYGYYIDLDQTSMQDSRGLSMYIAGDKNEVAWGKLPSNKQNVAGDTTKCPPLCCEKYTSFSDSSSIGKCPPSCPLGGDLYMRKVMNVIIIKAYRTK